jgi:hypothetical protein
LRLSLAAAACCFRRSAAWRFRSPARARFLADAARRFRCRSAVFTDRACAALRRLKSDFGAHLCVSGLSACRWQRGHSRETLTRSLSRSRPLRLFEQTW